MVVSSTSKQERNFLGSLILPSYWLRKRWNRINVCEIANQRVSVAYSCIQVDQKILMQNKYDYAK
jgi:hypothetical protein